MRNIILNVAVSLDGYIAGPNGEYDWCFTDQDYGMKEFFKRIDSALIGRKTYELMLKMGEAGYPGVMNYVFSKTMEPKNSKEVTFVSEDVAEFVKKLKNLNGKDIWLVGGGELIRTLYNEVLIDELMLSVHPIALGDGIPLFSKTNKRLEYQLTGSKEYSTGLVQLSYKLKVG